MIPEKLEIRNFLSYGPQSETVDFRNHHLICFSGKNGHGKSAVLDAITWALWGCARKTSHSAKADEGLVHLGQSDMKVTFDFSNNGQNYRVKREFFKTKSRAYTDLFFGIFEETKNEYTSLTEKTIRATQQKIIETLGLDYEAYLNSIFLRQGQANEFSKKSPQERKNIIASILGIMHYDELRQKALEKTKALAQKIEHCTTSRKHLEQELYKKNEVQALHLSVCNQIDAVTIEEEKLNKQKVEIKKRRAELEKQVAERSLVLFQQKHYENEYNQKVARIAELVKEWRATQKMQNYYKTLPPELRDKGALEEQLAKADAQYKRYRELHDTRSTIEQKTQQRLYEIKQTYNQKIQKLSSQQEKYDLEISALSILLKKLTTNQNELRIIWQEHSSACANYNEKLATKKISKEEIIQAHNHYERTLSLYHRLEHKMEELTKKEHEDTISLHLAATPSSESRCPLCEQDLSPEHRETITTKLKKHLSLSLHQKKRIALLLPIIKQKAQNQKSIHTDYITKHADYEKHLKLYEHEKKQADIARRHHEDNKRERQEKTTKHELLCNLKKAIEVELENLKKKSESYTKNDPLFTELSNQLMKLDQELVSLNYDEHRHEQVRLSYKKAHTYHIHYAEHEKNYALQEVRKKQVKETCNAARIVRRKLQDLKQSLHATENLASQKTSLEAEEKRLYDAQKKCNEAKLELSHKKGSSESHLKNIEQIARTEQALQEEIKHLETDYNDFAIIAQALGKDGIQALLIENALPEIELEANTLLSKLTDNQSQIQIESLRDLKSGKTKETLDITISDDVGIRPYELFSGGEAFRIDFALRIAISKVLARRAGSSLQTIIIDEGFGSQDEEGMNKILDVLYKIQDNFAKIIIVSHLPALKNQFPSQFFVQKKPTGSTVSVIEHC